MALYSEIDSGYEVLRIEIYRDGITMPTGSLDGHDLPGRNRDNAATGTLRRADSSAELAAGRPSVTR